MPRASRDDRAVPGSEARRAFLKKAAKAELAAPPAVSLIMTATGRPAEVAVPYWGPACVYQEKTGNTD